MPTISDQAIVDAFGDNFHGYPLLLQPLGENQWLMVLSAEPSCRLRLSAESELTKQLDQMGLSDENKLGDPLMDDQYVIRAEEPDAQSLLRHPAVVEAVNKLSPFVELELTGREYRLIKEGLADRSQIEQALQSLVELVEASGRQ